MKQGALIFDERSDRYDIRFDLADYYGGLHCGEIRNIWKFAKNGRKKSSKSFSDLLLHVLLRGGRIFSFYVIGQAGT